MNKYAIPLSMRTTSELISELEKRVSGLIVYEVIYENDVPVAQDAWIKGDWQACIHIAVANAGGGKEGLVR